MATDNEDDAVTPEGAEGGLVGRGSAFLAVGAVAAAGAALLNARTARRIDGENPPIGKFLQVDGVDLHYLEKGSGRPVVLLHGNGVTLEDMVASGLMDAAAARYRVIGFDRPGYGHSSRPRGTRWTPEAQAAVLAKALRGLGIDRPIVVGHSWGTLVTLALALDHPQDIAAAVLLSGYYYPSLRIDAALLGAPAVPLLGDLMRYTISPPLARMFGPAMIRKLFAPLAVDPKFDGYPIEMSYRPAQLRASAAEAAMMVPAASRLSARYHELAVPLFILTGDGDRIVAFDEQSACLHDALPESRLRVLEGVGHMVHYAACDEVMELIDAAADATGAE